MNGFLAPLNLEPRPSRWLARVRLAAHVLAAAAILLAHAPSAARGAFVLMLLAHGAWAWRRRLQPSSGVIRALGIDARGGWTVVTGDYGAQPARLLTVLCAEPWLLAFSVRDARGHRLEAAWLPDQLSAADARRLRVHLRAHAAVGEGDGG